MSKSHARFGLFVFIFGLMLTLVGTALFLARFVLTAASLVTGRPLPGGDGFEWSCLTMLVATATYYLGKETYDI